MAGCSAKLWGLWGLEGGTGKESRQPVLERTLGQVGKRHRAKSRGDLQMSSSKWRPQATWVCLLSKPTSVESVMFGGHCQDQGPCEERLVWSDGQASSRPSNVTGALGGEAVGFQAAWKTDGVRKGFLGDGRHAGLRRGRWGGVKLKRRGSVCVGARAKPKGVSIANEKGMSDFLVWGVSTGGTQVGS